MKLQLENISLEYAGKPPIFHTVNATIEPGEFVVITGPSGCGKSSLLRLINRLQEPTSGKISCDGKPLSDLDVTRVRRRIGYVQQTPIVIDDTVRNNLLLPFTYKSSDGQAVPGDDFLNEKLGAYLLKDIRLDDRAPELSVGQKQRIALIRTLLVNPEVLLCDEPTSALDSDSRTVVESELGRINRAGKATVILVTHTAFSVRHVTPVTYTLAANGLA
ncbi:MAG: ABC transporter ATP-binding protein [bacterium]|nr:ABC transporter ATP-binding protein [bacterium]